MVLQLWFDQALLLALGLGLGHMRCLICFAAGFGFETQLPPGRPMLALRSLLKSTLPPVLRSESSDFMLLILLMRAFGFGAGVHCLIMLKPLRHAADAGSELRSSSLLLSTLIGADAFAMRDHELLSLLARTSAHDT